MIVILETRINNDIATGQPISRAVDIWITDNVTNYIHSIGNLPLAGDLLPGLVANEAAIWLDAVTGGHLATAAETAKAELLSFLIDNPGAKQIFTVTRAELETAINDLVDAIVPLATAPNRTKLKRLLATGALLDRAQIAEE